ncbi:unnamed protein product, partial [Pylaiella littoralis]
RPSTSGQLSCLYPPGPRHLPPLQESTSPQRNRHRFYASPVLRACIQSSRLSTAAWGRSRGRRLGDHCGVRFSGRGAHCAAQEEVHPRWGR